MNSFVNGAVMMACVAIGVFFMKFWKDTGDRLFSMFAISFWLLACDRIIVEALGQSDVSYPGEYAARLASFLLIIAAVADKNRKT